LILENFEILNRKKKMEKIFKNERMGILKNYFKFKKWNLLFSKYTGNVSNVVVCVIGTFSSQLKVNILSTI